MRSQWPSQTTGRFGAIILTGFTCLLLATPLPALAWGKAGHRVVATLAMSLLTAEAQAQVAALLDPGISLAEISTWADHIRPSRPNTAPWH